MITAEGFAVSEEQDEMGEFMNIFERQCARDFEKQMIAEVQPGYHKTTHFAFLDVT